MGVSFINNVRSFYLQDGTVNDGYLLPDGVHLTKPATNKLVANLKLQLKHGEPSAHADHRRRGHPDQVAGPRGSSAGRVARNVQLPQSSTPFQRAPQSHFTKSKRHPQPPRATPSMQPAASPGATPEGREQGTQPWKHWEQQRHFEKDIVAKAYYWKQWMIGNMPLTRILKLVLFLWICRKRSTACLTVY